MAAAYGITSTGFIPKPFDVCYQEVKNALRATFGQGANVDDPSGPLGQLAGILADRESEIWDAMASLYASRDPNQADASALDSICTITGISRLPAMRSAVYVTLSGTPATVVPAGAVLSVVGTGVRFIQLADATIGVGGTVDRVQYAAENAGPVAAPAGTLTQIETPVGGWTLASNAADATLGSDIETDSDLRVRRTQALSSAGVSTIDAVRAAVLRQNGVTTCVVFENTTMLIDPVSNMPPKSIEVLVLGGVDQDIYTAVWRTKPAGIQSYGGQAGTVVDSLGISHTVSFTRPTAVPIYLVVNIKSGAGWPSDGPSQVIQQLVTWGAANLTIDADVVSYQLKRAITVAGISDIPALYIGAAANPTSETTVPIGSRQMAQLDSTRIVVNVS